MMDSARIEFSTSYERVSDFTPEPSSLVIYGHSPEQRSEWLDSRTAHWTGTSTVLVRDRGEDFIESGGREMNLRDHGALTAWISSLAQAHIYLDVTGLSNRINAALLKALWYCSREFSVLYVEPERYDIGSYQREGVLNDLSERIDGIEPMPGFATIVPADAALTDLIVLLGFEGGRFMHLVEATQTLGSNIVPYVGAPGFRVEYPFVATWGNRQALEETEAWMKLKYVTAASSVDLFLDLRQHLQSSASRKVKIAPLGLKTHVISAVLIAILFEDRVELVYDNPKRLVRKTDGIGRLHLTYVSKLLAAHRAT